MPIPVVSLPDQGVILTRPRTQGVYDTEGDKAATAIPATLTLFRSTTAFQVSTLGLTAKVKGRDTNLDGAAGALPKGDHLYVYDLICAASYRNGDLTTLTNVVSSEELARIRMARWFVWYFGQTPYLFGQFDEIPQGYGVSDIQTTHTNATVYPMTNGELDRQNGYDVTWYGNPTELDDLETFRVELNAAGVTPSPTVELYWTWIFRGTLLRGIRG